jgi:hypothetical protein
MNGSDARWRIPVLVVSGMAHLALLGFLALRHPELRSYAPPPVLEIQVVPRYLPSPSARTAPNQAAAQRPLRPRQAQRPAAQSSVAPLLAPAAPSPGPSTEREGAPATAGSPPPVSSGLREALRRSPVGCANADAVILDKAERERCMEMFGKGAKDAPFIPPPMARDKRRAFDAAAARKEANRRYRESNIPAGTVHEPRPSEAPRPMPEVWTPR